MTNAAINLGIGGIAGWRILQRTEASQVQAIAQDPVVQRSTAYFRENTASGITAEDLVGNYRLLSVALGAFGLEDDLPNKAFLRKILESDVGDQTSLVNRLSDKRYLRLAQAMGMEEGGNASANLGERISEAYLEREFERRVGEGDESLRLALNARRELESMRERTSSNNTLWYEVLGNPPLREVFEKAFGFGSDYGKLSVDRQLEEFTKASERYLGSADFKDIASAKLPDGDKRIRVTINGDEISSHNTFIFVPEEWDRKEKDQQAVLGVASNAMSFLLTITVLAAVVLGIIHWTRKKITTELVLYVMGSLFILRLVSFINQLPSIVAGFSTAQPYNNQLGILLAGAVVGALLISMIPAVLTAVAHFQINNSMQQASGPDLIEGIAIGIGLAGFFTFTNSMQPNLSPMWPALSQGGAAIPFLGVYISALGTFILSAAFMTFVVLFISEKTGSWSTRKGLFTIVFLLFGLMIAGEDGVTGIGSWIISGLLTGGLFLWLYTAAIRYNTAITVYAVSTLIIIEIGVRLMQGPPFPSASVGYMLAILTIVGVNFYWSKLVTK
jgi:hypothetical protein